MTSQMPDSIKALKALMTFWLSTVATRSHPEIVGNMSRVILNFGVSKIPIVCF